MLEPIYAQWAYRLTTWWWWTALVPLLTLTVWRLRSEDRDFPSLFAIAILIVGSWAWLRLKRVFASEEELVVLGVRNRYAFAWSRVSLPAWVLRGGLVARVAVVEVDGRRRVPFLATRANFRRIEEIVLTHRR